VNLRKNTNSKESTEKMAKKEKNVVTKEVKIPVEVSARHIHLCKNDLEKLFGKGYKLKSAKTLSQPKEFAAEETVDLVYGKQRMHDVRVMGPVRKASQVELSLTDAYELGLKALPKLRLSGHTIGSINVTVSGPKGNIKVPCIIPKRHMHMSEKKAKELGIKDKQDFYVRIPGKRALIFDNVIVRVSKDYKTAMHIDTDEGNAAGVTTGKGDGKLILEYEKEKEE